MSHLFGRGKQTQYLQRSRLPYKFKTRFSMIGTVGSGKSTVAAGLVLTAQTLVHDKNSKFLCRFLEGESNILDDAANLRSGRFPKKTDAYVPYNEEAGLLMLWSNWRGAQKKIHLPICDVAGEDIQAMIRRVGVAPEDGGSFLANSALLQYVKDSDGFIVVVPASRALLWESEFQVEAEVDMPELSFNPDTNLARLLGEVFTHKDRSHGRKTKGIAVVITKWDMLAPYAANQGLEFYDQNDNIIFANIDRFMELCFPATSTELKASGLNDEQIQFFPSYFLAARNREGDIIRWPNGTIKIQNHILQNRRVPKYAEKSYVRMFNWLQQYAS